MDFKAPLAPVSAARKSVKTGHGAQRLEILYSYNGIIMG
jgi:hypothetical protein